MKPIHRRVGQALVEFALTLPILLLIMVAFIELGRVVYYYTALSGAVREGARYATVHQFPSSAERQAEVEQTVAGYAIWMKLNAGDVAVYCNQDPVNQDNPCATYVTVMAHVEIAPMVTLMARLIGSGNTFNITSQSTMQMTPYGVVTP